MQWLGIYGIVCRLRVPLFQKFRVTYHSSGGELLKSELVFYDMNNRGVPDDKFWNKG